MTQWHSMIVNTMVVGSIPLRNGQCRKFDSETARSVNDVYGDRVERFRSGNFDLQYNPPLTAGDTS